MKQGLASMAATFARRAASKASGRHLRKLEISEGPRCATENSIPTGV